MSMKVATVGLMAIAVAQASLFEDFEELNEESFGLTEDWGDLDEGRALQNTDDFGNVITDYPEETAEPTETEGDDDSDRMRNKRGGRGRGRGRGRQNRRGKKGRRGRKNKKGGKKGKGEGFNLAKYEARQAKKLAKVAKKSAAKCEKRAKFQAAVCGQAEDNEDCTLWAEAMQAKCLSNSGCKLGLARNQGQCSGAYKAMLSSFRKDDSPLMEGFGTSALIGECFKITIDDAQKCFADSKKETEKRLSGVEVPSEEAIAEVRAQLKAEKKAGRKNRRGGRKNRRGGRKNQNKRWQNKKQNNWSNKKWDQGKQRWETKEDFTKEKYEEFIGEDDDV